MLIQHHPSTVRRREGENARILVGRVLSLGLKPRSRARPFLSSTPLGLKEFSAAVESWSPSAELVGYPKSIQKVPKSVASDGAGGVEQLWGAGTLARHFFSDLQAASPTWLDLHGGFWRRSPSLLWSEMFLVQCWERQRRKTHHLPDFTAPGVAKSKPQQGPQGWTLHRKHLRLRCCPSLRLQSLWMQQR